MYLEFFGLKEKPFSLTPDPKYFFLSETHKTNLDLSLYGIKTREGFIVITGAIGTGKTTMCRMILEKMDRKTHSALVLNPFISEDELLESVLHDFGITLKSTGKSTKQEMINQLNQFLLNALKGGENALLIIDEAQNLPLPVLEQIRILSNLETEKEKLLQIILVGQLGLMRLLQSSELKQLDQRISVKCQLSPLKKEEIPKYIEHRLMVAGSKGQINFTPKALAVIHEYSLGIPRMINLICDRALLGAYTLQTTDISKEVVVKAVQNLKLQRKEPKMTLPGTAPSGKPMVRMPILIAGIIAVAFAIGFLIYMNILGLNERRAKRNIERQYAQLKVSRQIERARTENEVLELQDQIKELKARPVATPETPAVAIPEAWKGSSTIFVGVFDERLPAVEKVKGMRGVKQKAHIIGIGTEEGGRKYLLVLGNFKDEEEAVGVLDELQIQGELLDAEVMPFTEVLKVK
ncbi:MAG: AAA family ATPase [Candidatus Brocadiales bacterium]|nr:AAA family ATPase [Candidatus Bathyanammoxibius amoris]